MIEKLKNEILLGEKISKQEALQLLKEPLEKICEAANEIREKLCKNDIELCTIINGMSGCCTENCKFCAQSAHHHTGVDEYGFVGIEEIMEEALANQAEGADRFGLVTSGRRLDGEDFEHAIEAYKKMKADCSISLCAGHGLLRREQFNKKRIH